MEEWDVSQYIPTLTITGKQTLFSSSRAPFEGNSLPYKPQGIWGSKQWAQNCCPKESINTRRQINRLVLCTGKMKKEWFLRSDSFNCCCSMKNYTGLKVDARRLASSKCKKFKQFLVIWLRTGKKFKNQFRSCCFYLSFGLYYLWI